MPNRGRMDHDRELDISGIRQGGGLWRWFPQL